MPSILNFLSSLLRATGTNLNLNSLIFERNFQFIIGLGLTLDDLVVKRLMTGTLEVKPYTQEGRRDEVGVPKQGGLPVPLLVPFFIGQYWSTLSGRTETQVVMEAAGGPPRPAHHGLPLECLGNANGGKRYQGQT